MALQDLVGPGLKVHVLSGHANLVDSEWEPDPNDDSEQYEPVDGYAGENVWFSRISPDIFFGAYFWDLINGESWLP